MIKEPFHFKDSLSKDSFHIEGINELKPELIDINFLIYFDGAIEGDSLALFETVR